MTGYIIAAALAACLGLSGALWLQAGALDDLRDDNALLTRNLSTMKGQAEQARLAATVADASRQRVERLNTDANATIEEIRNLKLGECADAPLDPALSDILNSVR